jgi:O-antigen ligase
MPIMTMLRSTVLDRKSLTQAADWLAVGVAVSLPWSTSATGIFIALWLVAALATLDVAAVRRELLSAAGGLPVLLWLLAVVGMSWAGISWSERYAGLSGFNRLLVIPLLLAHFRKSDRGMWVLYGYLAAALCVLAVSWALVLIPGLPWRGLTPGAPTKSYVFQSESFLLCVFFVLDAACGCWRARRWRMVLALVALAVLLIANIAFVSSGRTTFLVAPVLAVMLGWRQFGAKGILAALLAAGVVMIGLWFASPYLRATMNRSVEELHAYLATNEANSTGEHLEFLRKSLGFVETAPFIGHGTGTIAEQFRHSVAGKTGAGAIASDNPHNEIFAVAIQLGGLGAGVLIAMWAAHLLLFRGAGLTAWIGMIVVVENIVGSVVNSHLFDFTQGWLYVFGVGVAGGMVLRNRAGGAAAVASPIHDHATSEPAAIQSL